VVLELPDKVIVGGAALQTAAGAAVELALQV
jgi:hypothetical protein